MVLLESAHDRHIVHCGVAMTAGPDETFRGTLQARTPEGEFTTMIVMRRGLGHAGRVWLTFDGAIKTTVVMTNAETEQMGELLDKAMVGR